MQHKLFVNKGIPDWEQYLRDTREGIFYYPTQFIDDNLTVISFHDIGTKKDLQCQCPKCVAEREGRSASGVHFAFPSTSIITNTNCGCVTVMPLCECTMCKLVRGEKK